MQEALNSSAWFLSEAGLDDLYGSFPTRDILWFYDSVAHRHNAKWQRHIISLKITAGSSSLSVPKTIEEHQSALINESDKEEYWKNLPPLVIAALGVSFRGGNFRLEDYE